MSESVRLRGRSYYESLLLAMTEQYFALISRGVSPKEAKAYIAEHLWDEVESLCIMYPKLEDEIARRLRDQLARLYENLPVSEEMIRPPRALGKLIALFQRHLREIFGPDRVAREDPVKLRREAELEACSVALTVAKTILLDAMGVRPGEGWWWT